MEETYTFASFYFPDHVEIVEQDALMSTNPRGKLEDLAAGCACCLVV